MSSETRMQYSLYYMKVKSANPKRKCNLKTNTAWMTMTILESTLGMTQGDPPLPPLKNPGYAPAFSRCNIVHIVHISQFLAEG